VSFVPLGLFWMWLGITDGIYRRVSWDPGLHHPNPDLAPLWAEILVRLWLPLFIISVAAFLIHGIILRKRGWRFFFAKLLVLPPFLALCVFTVFHVE
jgi:hypothetical protein